MPPAGGPETSTLAMADELAAARRVLPGKEALYRDAITKFQTALILRQRIGLSLFTSGRSSGKTRNAPVAGFAQSVTTQIAISHGKT